MGIPDIFLSTRKVPCLSLDNKAKSLRVASNFQESIFKGSGKVPYPIISGKSKVKAKYPLSSWQVQGELIESSQLYWL